MARYNWIKVWKDRKTKDYHKQRRRAIWRRLKKIFPNQQRNDFNRIHKHYAKITIYFD